MGQSPTGIIFYGINYNEEDELGEIVGDNPEETYAKKKGWADVEYVEEEKDREKHKVWSENLAKQSAITHVCPVEIGTQYGYDYSIPYICIKASELRACEDASEIDPKSLYIQPEWDEQIKDFCEVMGIEYTQPKWYLTSIYG